MCWVLCRVAAAGRRRQRQKEAKAPVIHGVEYKNEWSQKVALKDTACRHSQGSFNVHSAGATFGRTLAYCSTYLSSSQPRDEVEKIVVSNTAAFVQGVGQLIVALRS